MTMEQGMYTPKGSPGPAGPRGQPSVSILLYDEERGGKDVLNVDGERPAEYNSPTPEECKKSKKAKRRRRPREEPREMIKKRTKKRTKRRRRSEEQGGKDALHIENPIEYNTSTTDEFEDTQKSDKEKVGTSLNI